MNRIRFNIEGLEQPETSERVRNQLEGLIGVQSVSLSEGQTYVDVNYNDDTSHIEINNHLQNNGYKVTDIT